MVIIGVLALIVAGVHAMLSLPIDAFPDVSSTQVKVIIKSPGLTPEEVESRITAPIEVELLGIPKQTMLRSVAKYGLTDVTVDFADGTDIYWARQQVTERLNNVWNNLPSNVSGGIAPLTTPLGEMLMFTVEGANTSLMDRRNTLDWVIRPQLRTVHGVADVNTVGGMVRSFEVAPDQARMAARGITLSALQEALIRNNQNDGAGRLNDGEEAILVRAEGRYKTLSDIANTVLRANPNAPPVLVGDVATVRMGALTRYGAVSRNGTGETVQGIVLGLRGANARQVVKDVRARLNSIQLPAGMSVHIFYDRGHLVGLAVRGVVKALLEAIVLVLILLMLFLGNLRAALTVAMVLPLAALITFLLMHWFGLSANLMSLGGLCIAIGMLVDAAVVVVENISHHLVHNQNLDRFAIIKLSTQEVAPSVVTGILIIIAVFLPLLTLQGLEAKQFTPVAKTISFALAGSLVLSLTVIPVLATLLLKQLPTEMPWLVRKLDNIYAPLLDWALRHSRSALLATLGLLIVTVFLYSQIGKIFMPIMSEGDLVIATEKIASMGLDESVRFDLRLQKEVLKRVPEVKEIVTRAGTDEIGLDPMAVNQSDQFLKLKPQRDWRFPNKETLIQGLREVLKDLPGATYLFAQPIEMRVNEMILGVRGDLAVKIFGPNTQHLQTYARQIMTILKSIRGSDSVYTPQNEGVQYLGVHINHMAAGRLGLDVMQVEDSLRAHLEGKVLGIVLEGQRRTPLLLRSEGAVRAPLEHIADLQLSLPNGMNVPLSTIAEFSHTNGPVKIDRQQGSRMVVVTTDVRGRDTLSFVMEAQEKVAKQVKLSEGYYITWGGQFENQQRATQRLSIVVPIALLMIFLILYLTFQSLVQAGLILTTIPFAMIGGVFSLWLSGEYLSVPASVGFIALLGIAVLNGVVMVSYFNQLKITNPKWSIGQVVMEGAQRRLRPVLMTASIAAAGLLPLLFAQGPGAEVQRPLAIVVIGGLFTSTLLTLLLVPILYRWAENRKSHVV